MCSVEHDTDGGLSLNRASYHFSSERRSENRIGRMVLTSKICACRNLSRFFCLCWNQIPSVCEIGFPSKGGRRRGLSLLKTRAAKCSLLYLVVMGSFVLVHRRTPLLSPLLLQTFSGNPPNVITRHGSGMYTPYHLIPGGGEKVFLSFLKTFQQFSAEMVDVFLDEKNKCRKIACMKHLAEQLDVNGISWSRVRVKQKQSIAPIYNIWFEIGNSLSPHTFANGRFSIYHCQFPFNGLKYQTLEDFRRLTTYDVVYLNSRYTYDWYMVYLATLRSKIVPGQTRDTTVSLPSVLHFPPPFKVQAEQSRSDTVDVRSVQQEKRVSGALAFKVILLGRFFDGLQCKNHELAIEAFEKLQAAYFGEAKLSLILIGNPAVGSRKYINHITRLGKKPYVRMVLKANHETVKREMEDSDIVWSITGMKKQTIIGEPEDAEHFGIGLLECMAAGTIPVVINRGGPVEILEGLPDYLIVDTVDQLAKVTVELIDLPCVKLRRLKALAQRRALELSGAFDAGLEIMFTTLGKRLKPDNKDVWFAVRERQRRLERPYKLRPSKPAKPCPQVAVSQKAILYVETRINLTLRAALSQLLNQLGPEWRVHIWHTESILPNLQTSLEGLDCIVYHSLDDFLLPQGGLNPRQEGAYQHLWKSRDFLLSLGSNVQHVLTFQSDVWFPPSSSFQQSWTEYVYIGAPWCHEGNWGYIHPSQRPPEATKMLHDTRQIPSDVRVGNGGVSLRHVPSMMHAIDTHSRDSPKQENEDVFYVLSFIDDDLHIAPLEKAASFGAEILCPDVRVHREFRHNIRNTSAIPFALHKPFDVIEQLKEAGANVFDILNTAF